MEWYFILLLMIGGLLAILCMGMPVAYGFLTMAAIAAPFVWSLTGGLSLLSLSVADSLINFALLPIPLFIFMGEIIFHSNVAPQIIDTLDRWFGRVPGRLSLMAVVAGVVFSTLTGTSIASTAMLGSSLVPEMKRKGYSNAMSIGPILGSGQLALMIPPSALAVLLGAIAGVSIGQILIAIILPGILMALLFCTYIVIRCALRPELAPPYTVKNFTFKEKMAPTLRYVIPVFFIIFCVVGVIYFGIATPTEASATGAMACLLYVAYLKRATKEVLVKSLTGTVRLSVMILLIVATSSLFSQILSYSGAARGLTNLVADAQVNRYFIFIGMMAITFILGMFLSSQPIIMICIPVFMPIVSALGFNEIWFCVLFLLNLEIGTITPPFGLALFVMKGAAGKETTMREVIMASVPFIALDFVAMIIFTVFPSTCLWLVRTMG